jgi:serine protease Do
MLKFAEFYSRSELSAYFPGDPNPMPARLIRISMKHDVALIKVDSPGVLPYVELETEDNEPALGEPITILGYPSVSMDVIGVTRNADFGSPAVESPIYSPTLTTGNMGKRIAQDIVAKDSATEYLWAPADVYQLTANATGAGNSGGPVFSSQGRVTGIFFAGMERGGARVTYAIPIKYGRELIEGYKSLLKDIKSK